MPTVTSADGTQLALTVEGQGPALVVVAGALNDRRSFATMAAGLAADFTVHRYDRRGRGDSGDTQPYAVEREVEDLAAVVDSAGAELVFGHSSGAILALEAAAAGLAVRRLAVYEPPYGIRGEGPPDLRERVTAALAAGLPGDAVAAFLTYVSPQGWDGLDGLRASPAWPRLLALAPTLPYDLAIAGDQLVPADRLAGINATTLAVYGKASPAAAYRVAQEVAAAVPGSRILGVPGQHHQVSGEVLAPLLRGFFGS